MYATFLSQRGYSLKLECFVSAVSCLFCFHGRIQSSKRRAFGPTKLWGNIDSYSSAATCMFHRSMARRNIRHKQVYMQQPCRLSKLAFIRRIEAPCN